ncbi:YitT family protein [candidate division WOR-3 bacterium]|nr:YitT family protein [candidate division WOR-3 bacterium]
MKKDRLKKHVIDYSGITIGALLYGIGYSWFLIPFKIAPGGVGGLSQILYFKLHIPAGISMLIFNIPLFFIGIKYLGKSFGIKTLYAIVVGSIFTDIFAISNLMKWGILVSAIQKYHAVTGVYSMTDNILLASFAGSVILGAGIGIIFKFRGSTGGTDIPVAIMRKKLGFSAVSGYFLVETSIILTITLVFREPNILILAYLNLFISSKICDMVLEGLPYVKGVYIVTDSKYEADIKDKILKQLNRGVTVFKAEGGFTGVPRNVLFCVINRREIEKLKDIIKETDKNSFLIINDVYDVIGTGFRSRLEQ